MNTIFGCFDHAYVVNFDRDTDRMKRVSSRLNKLNIPFERFPALPPSPAASRFERPEMIHSAGCARSRSALLNLILERGHDTALLLEDDVVFRDDVNQWMEIISPQVVANSWDMLYLGLHLERSGGRVSANLARVKTGWHCHAYAVRRKAIPLMLECMQQNWANPVATFDAFDNDNLIKLYTIPILAVQEPNQSIDRLPQYFSVFDGNDFEHHCQEMQDWHSDWREVVAFSDACRRVEHSYRGSTLQDVAAGILEALSVWPAFETALQSTPGYLDAKRHLTSDLTDERELLDACDWFRRARQHTWSRLFEGDREFSESVHHAT